MIRKEGVCEYQRSIQLLWAVLWLTCAKRRYLVLTLQLSFCMRRLAQYFGMLNRKL